MDLPFCPLPHLNAGTFDILAQISSVMCAAQTLDPALDLLL